MRQDLARAYTGVQIMRFNGLRALAQAAEGRPPGPEASIAKLVWSEYHRWLGEVAIGITGTDGLVRPDGQGYPTTEWQNVFLSSRAGTIYSGTSEIQRNIISERALGLPKEPRQTMLAAEAAGQPGPAQGVLRAPQRRGGRRVGDVRLGSLPVRQPGGGRVRRPADPGASRGTRRCSAARPWPACAT